MLKYFLLTTLFVSFFNISFSQNNSVIKGKVADSVSNKEIALATVALINNRDSSLISYTLTKNDGSFEFSNIEGKMGLKILISFMGYESFRQIIELKNGLIDLGIIRLTERATTLKEVNLTGERSPIVYRKDTVEFNAEAFKTRPNAMVEELLKKLPGMQVNLNGSIFLNGKKVSKLKVNGKNYFATDITIATKNLNASYVDKIQIYDDWEEDPNRTREASKVEKIINLKLKKDFLNSAFGKVYFGAGTKKRFEVGGLFNTFRDTLQVSLISFGNNINRSAFSNQDLYSMGGFQRSGTQIYETGINFGENSFGVQNIGSGGVNINYDLKNKLQLNLTYFYGYNSNKNMGNGTQQQFFGDSVLRSQSVFAQFFSQKKHNFTSVIEWKIDSVSYLRYTPRLDLYFNNISGYSNIQSGNNFNSTTVQGNTISSGNEESTNYSHLTYYRRQFQNKDVLTITNTVKLNPNKGSDYYENLLTELPSAINYSNRLISQTKSQDYFGIETFYRKQLTKKFNSDIIANYLYEHNLQELFSFNFNPQTGRYDSFLNEQSENQKRNQSTYFIRHNAVWNIKDNISVNIGLRFQYQHVSNRFENIDLTLNRTFFNLLPSLKISIGNLSVNYDLVMRQPSISNLQPVSIQSEPLYTYSGNPDLKPTLSHSFSLYYNKNYTQHQIDYSIFFSGTLDRNGIIFSRDVNLSTGMQYSRPVNANGNYNFFQSININKRFKTTDLVRFKLNGEVNAAVSRTYFIRNNFSDFQQLYDIGGKLGFSTSWKSYIDIEPSFVYNKVLNTYDFSRVQNNDFYRSGLNTQLIIHWPKDITFESNYNVSYNSQIANSYNRKINLLNASVSIMIHKARNGQIRLTAFDLLNQNQGIYSWAADNSLRTSTSSVLHQYFLVGYQYSFNKVYKR